MVSSRLELTKLKVLSAPPASAVVAVEAMVEPMLRARAVTWSARA